MARSVGMGPGGEDDESDSDSNDDRDDREGGDGGNTTSHKWFTRPLQYPGNQLYDRADKNENGNGDEDDLNGIMSDLSGKNAIFPL